MVEGRAFAGIVWHSGSHCSTYEQKIMSTSFLSQEWAQSPTLAAPQRIRMSVVVLGGLFEDREQESWADAVPQRKLRMEGENEQGPASEQTETTLNLLEITQGFHNK